MKRVVQITADGSATIAIPDANITYRSKHGAIQESMHVFIETGLKPLIGRYETINIFEIGFGTGLNALLALREACNSQQKISFTTVELYPLEESEYRVLNFGELLGEVTLQEHFLQMHLCEWDKEVLVHPLFKLHKIKSSLIQARTVSNCHCIFFDAFAPNDQPELWTKEIFAKMFDMLENRGILVTYCCKGDVRRALAAAGFTVQKLSGAPGKKEMLRAIKIGNLN